MHFTLKELRLICGLYRITVLFRLLGGDLLYILKYTSDDVSTSRHNGAVNPVCNFNVNCF